jgi:hypothetical protein
MSQSPTAIDNLSEDEAATLILVDANDSPLGSVSLSERLVLENNAKEHVIARFTYSGMTIRLEKDALLLEYFCRD